MNSPTFRSAIPIFEQAKAAVPHLQQAEPGARVAVLEALAGLLLQHQDQILAANARDGERASGPSARKDRLLLTEARIRALAEGVLAVATMPDPLGVQLYEYTHPKGMRIRKVSAPLGVVGVVYESRPNVTIDVAALCLRAGNGVILRGGSDAEHSNAYLVSLIQEALAACGLPRETVQLLPPDREYVRELLRASAYVDVLIPRGSQELIEYVRKHATVPAIETGAGVCHTYAEASADPEMAARIIVNAKVSRPSVCNALDTILLDETLAEKLLPLLLPDFLAQEVEMYADEASWKLLRQLGYPHLRHARPKDYGREFLDYACSLRLVSGFEEALAHIRHYSSRHSEAIVTQDEALAARFLQEVDAAAVYVNASTRFTDGGEFGLGAEIGISTQKLHARGPFALEKLTTEKWIIHGSGQVR